VLAVTPAGVQPVAAGRCDTQRVLPKTSPARRLVVVYAVLMAFVDLFALLPRTWVLSVRGAVGTIGVQALIVWRLLHGSPIEWALALAFAVLSPVTVFLLEPGREAGLVLCTVSVAQSGLLCAPQVLAFVRSRSDNPVASS
jgi:hypothetical protein